MVQYSKSKECAGMKKKVIVIVSILIAVLAVAGGIGIYNHQKEEQAAIAAEEKKEQEAELKEYQTRYKELKAQSENLILSEEEQNTITEELQKAEENLDKKDITQAKKVVGSLEQKITQIGTANVAMLTEKAGQVTDYHTSFYSTENQSVLDTMLAEYNDLLNAKAYKSANAKLDELLAQIVALKEPEQEKTAVAKTETTTKKTSGNEKQQTATSGETTIPEPYTEEYYDWLESVTGKTPGYSENIGQPTSEGYTNGDGTGIHWEEYDSTTEVYSIK